MSIFTDDLTDRQYSVLSFIVAYQQKHHMAPTVREIATHVGTRSPVGVHRILEVLKSRGYLVSEPAKNRAWRFSGTLSEAGIPVVGAIAAGAPAEALNDVEEELAVSPDVFGGDYCFALRVRGDSMIDAHSVEGDLAIIRPPAPPQGGNFLDDTGNILDDAGNFLESAGITWAALKIFRDGMGVRASTLLEFLPIFDCQVFDLLGPACKFSIEIPILAVWSDSIIIAYDAD